MLGQFSKALGGKVGDLISLEKWVGPQREESIPAQRTIITPQDLLEEDDGREAILQTLESAFYQKGFDAVVHQLELLPPLVDNTVIDDIVESRTGVLEVTGRKHCAFKFVQQGPRAISPPDGIVLHRSSVRSFRCMSSKTMICLWPVSMRLQPLSRPCRWELCMLVA